MERLDNSMFFVIVITMAQAGFGWLLSWRFSVFRIGFQTSRKRLRNIMRLLGEAIWFLQPYSISCKSSVVELKAQMLEIRVQDTYL